MKLLGSTSDKKIDLILVIYLLIILVASGLFAYFLPFPDKDLFYRLLTLLVPLLAILFGFSLTIISIIGGIDQNLHQHSWSSLVNYERTFKKKIFWQSILCLFYLLAIIISLFAVALEPLDALYCLLMRGAYFLLSLSILASLCLPISLYRLYKERYALMKEEAKKTLSDQTF